MTQKFAWFYSVLFIFVVALGYIPGFTNEEGLLFGLFSLQIHDDLLHLGSGVWAGIAAWRSHHASVLYFKIFGILYGLDGVFGLITGSGYLDLGIFLNGINPLPWNVKIAANLPHIAIGGMACTIGFILSRKIKQQIPKKN